MSELRGLRRHTAKLAALKRAVDPKPSGMPSVGGPINEGEGQEKDLRAILLAEQAHAELATLVIEE